MVAINTISVGKYKATNVNHMHYFKCVHGWFLQFQLQSQMLFVNSSCIIICTSCTNCDSS